VAHRRRLGHRNQADIEQLGGLCSGSLPDHDPPWPPSRAHLIAASGGTPSAGTLPGRGQ
jgi:hypothetical protein